MAVERVIVGNLAGRNPYYRIWAGETVALSQINAGNAGYRISVDQKVGEGEIAGQYVFDENLDIDMLLCLVEPVEDVCMDGAECCEPSVYQPRLFIL